MAICPKCRESITLLLTEVTATTMACLTKEGTLDIDECLMDCYETNEFRCSDCGEVLFMPSERTEAEKFLKQ